MATLDVEIEDDEFDLPGTPAAVPSQCPPGNLSFGGVHVLFPYIPYESQKRMMNSMIQGMNSSQNCLLESPTGTGKTAALLCASLAWLENETKKNPQRELLVIYASRTHSQLQQVVDQLKKTPYKNTPMVILSSRKQTCINKEAQKSGAVDVMCEIMRANHVEATREHPKDSGGFPTCSFYANFKKNGPGFENYLRERAEGGPVEPWDLEDLGKFGTRCTTCPYYEIREVQKNAKLVLCTYNHLLHPWIRIALGLDVEGNVVIFDEAHNIESNCMDIGSRKISLNKLERTIIPALNEASARLDIPDRKREPLMDVVLSFTNLLEWMREQESAENNKFQQLGDFKVRRISDPIKELSTIGFSPEGVQTLYTQMLTLTDRNYEFPFDPVVAAFKVDGSAMRSISSILFTFYTLFEKDSSSDSRMRLEHYSVDLRKGIISEDEPVLIELCVTCLSPHIIFQDMGLARSVVVASGTLSPINSFSSELGMRFHRKLSAPHVIGQDRIFARIISSYAREKDNLSFNFSFDTLHTQNKFNEQARALGNFLHEACQKIPNGILVLFPSKGLASSLKTSWEMDGTLKRISDLKRPFFEHEISPADLKHVLDEYRTHAVSDGAVMLGFLRGRISEGIDFADDQARAVITVGIPFGFLPDLSITRKKDYNDKMVKKYGRKQRVSGHDWYTINAFRAVNQGLGRCVRHKDDWGVIFMVDSRFFEYRSNVSGWVKKSIVQDAEMGMLENIEKKLEQFLSSMKIPETGCIASPEKRLKVCTA